MNYITIAKLNKNILGKYKQKIITSDVILTEERLNNHILKYYKIEYLQISAYIKIIIEKPDLIIEDNSHRLYLA